MQEYTIPLIIRGETIEDDLVDFEARRGLLVFHAPDVKKYLTRIVLRDPILMQDLYELSMDDIMDYLDELGRRLALDINPHMEKAAELSDLTSGHSSEMGRHIFQQIPRIFRRDVVKEILEQNIGTAYLEGWVERKLRDGRMVAVRAFGARGAHIIAGNSPVVAAHSVLYNAVSRSDGIIKIPSNDPLTATAIARTMIEMAPGHPLTKHLTVAYWKGGDSEFEEAFYKNNYLEKIVAWGGFASMEHIRSYLGPGLDLISLDPKLSATIIGKEAFSSEDILGEVARRAAADIGYFNQGGCLSARVVYVESGTDPEGIERLNRLGKLIFEEIQSLPSHLSSPHPAFDPVLRSEIDGIRYSDAYRVIGGKGAEGAIIVSQLDETVDFADRLNCRVANLVPVDDIQDAVRNVTIHTQTIGVYPDSLKKMIRDRCALQGGQRITSLGYATAEGLAAPHDAMEQLRRMVRWVVEESFDETRGGVGVLHGN